ncbi:hypothetical protein DP923_00950 [Pontibacter arcticus]|uniref:YD repeat-containing protein n=1 Tax=Pontibacter arcticus TaxID=2080288 RepID=A0A364RHB5_9BACT|nr:hypothetical protein [Pontibacter arcticus]RAU83673.1 hypothetical protein DP923_00950 [Pontibacter arcticus]
MISPAKMKSNFLNRTFFYVIAAMSFAVTACDKDDSEEAAPAVVDAPCKVTEINADGQASKLEYNADGFITKITAADTDEDGNPVTTTESYTYNAANQLTKTELRIKDKLINTAVYTYQNGYVQSVKRTYSQPVSESVTTFKYDGNKRIAEKSVLSDGITYTTKYTYDGNGNIEKEEGFYEGNLDSRTVYSGYDDKPAPYVAVKGKPMVEETVSKNNPGKMITNIMYDLNGDGVPEPESVYEVTYKYEYNSNGFPVKVLETDSYGDETETRFTYECK